MDDIDSLEYTIPDCKNKSEKQLKEALIERLINAYYNQINNKFNQRKDNSYDRQDLTDALDACLHIKMAQLMICYNNLLMIILMDIFNNWS